MENQKKQARPDPIIVHLGDMGRYQFFCLILLYLTRFPIGFIMMSHLFLAAKSEYYCVQPSNADPCSKECETVDFNRSIFSETIEMTFDLFCDRFWLSSLSQFAVMGGIMIGAIIFGVLSDRYGRWKLLLIECALQFTFGVAVPFSIHYIMYILLRLLTAIATGGQMTTSFVLMMEIIGPNARVTMANLSHIPFCLSIAILTLLAYFLRDWRYFHLSLFPFCAVFLLYICLIYESPRWLFTTGRLEKAIHVTEIIAKKNGRPNESIILIRSQMEEAYKNRPIDSAKEQGNLLDLFRTPNICKNTIIMAMEWLNACTVFYGSTQYISRLNDDVFLNVFISGVISAPGCIISIFIVKYLGRRNSIIITNFVSALSFLLLPCMTDITPTVVVVFAVVGLVGVTVTFPSLYIYASEIFPTVVRTTGMGICSCFGRIGSMIAPFITSDLARISPIIPPLVYGSIAALGFILAFFLPETKNQSVVETIADGEALGKKNKAVQ
uniref:Major facilitator superfamily (MFS) profile domain-containing protein n=1 Tax=Glossina brevipalpis TaxID=37001 RepID=A0A1A9X1T3_9MUSC